MVLEAEQAFEAGYRPVEARHDPIAAVFMAGPGTTGRPERYVSTFTMAMTS